MVNGRQERLRGFLYFIVADAGSANANPFGGAGNYRTYLLQVDVPASVRNIVGVADLMTEYRPTTTDITYFCH